MRTIATFLRRGFDTVGVIDSFALFSRNVLTVYAGNSLAYIIAKSTYASLQVTATLAMNSNGTVTRDGTSGATAWHYAPAAGLGSSYWALVTITNGTVTTGTVGSRVSLATGHTWTATTTGSSDTRLKECSGTFQIWDAASGGNMVSSGTFGLSAAFSILKESLSSVGGSAPDQNEPTEQF